MLVRNRKRDIAYYYAEIFAMKRQALSHELALSDQAQARSASSFKAECLSGILVTIKCCFERALTEMLSAFVYKTLAN
jgi:hypothetical protein